MNSEDNSLLGGIGGLLVIIFVFGIIAIITPIGLSVPIPFIQNLSCENNMDACIVHILANPDKFNPEKNKEIEEPVKPDPELEKAREEREEAEREAEIAGELREAERIRDQEERDARDAKEERERQEEQDRIDAEEKEAERERQEEQDRIDAEEKEARERARDEEIIPGPEEPESLLFIFEPIEQFVLIGGNSENLQNNGENCDKFNKRHPVTRIFFGRYHIHQCAKAVVVFDMLNLNTRLSEGEQIDNDEIMFSFTEIEIEPLLCKGIDLPEEDKASNCNSAEEGDFSSELKYKFSDSSQCGLADEVFNDLEEWNTITEWPEYRYSHKMNILPSISYDIETGRYLCLAFSEDSSPDKTGDREQYFRLWALNNLEITLNLVNR